MYKVCVQLAVLWGLAALCTPAPVCSSSNGRVACSGYLYNFTGIEDFFAQNPTKNYFSFELLCSEGQPTPYLHLTDIFHGASFQHIFLECPLLTDIAADTFAASRDILKSFTLQNYNNIGAPRFGTFNLTSILGPLTSAVVVRGGGLEVSPTLDCGGRSGDSFFYALDMIYLYQSGRLNTDIMKNCSTKNTVFELINSQNIGTLSGGNFYVGDKDESSLTIRISNTTLQHIYDKFINTDDLKDDAHVKVEVHFESNQLDTIDQHVYKDYFDMENMDINIYYADNALGCDCRLAWLVREPKYMFRVVDNSLVYCNGTLPLSRLLPQDFAHCP